jgi:hypothetical protein
MEEFKDLWFSPRQANYFGFCIYKTFDGKEVKVTEAIDIGLTPGSRQEDLVFVGRGTFLRTCVNKTKYLLLKDLEDLCLDFKKAKLKYSKINFKKIKHVGSKF